MVSSQDAPPPKEPRLFATLKHDVKNVGRDLTRQGLKSTIGRTFDDLEAFYLSTHAKERLAGMNPVKWALFLAWWLIKSMLLKLTPARRVMLALGLILIVTGGWNIRVSTEGAPQVSMSLPLGGILLLLVVIMLELKDKLLARDELEAGRTVQLALTPECCPQVPGWDLWLYTRPANDVGGDLVDFLHVDRDRYAVSLGDVAGKGLPAALLMAKLQSTLRALVPGVASLGELGAAVNRILHRDGLPNRFATLVYLELAGGSGRVRLLNAGHMPPLVVRGTTIEELPRGSMALGIVPQAEFSEHQVDLAEHDCLVVYSDGITEAMNESGEFFGDERLRSVLQQHTGVSAEQTGAAVLAAVEAFVGGARTHDDVSVVVARRTR